MAGRAQTLARLAALYTMVEELRAIERERATLNVLTAEQAAVQQAADAFEALRDGRRALGSSDRQDALLHEAAREIASFNADRLLAQRAEYQRLEEAAAALHRVALMQQKQMETLVRVTRARAALEQARRDQAIADDRFNSRARWLEAGAERRIKNS